MRRFRSMSFKNDFVMLSRHTRRLKAGCSQDWPAHKGWKFLNLLGAVAV